MTRLLISVTWDVRRLPIEAVRSAQRAKKLTSASSHAECGYARGAWCCCQTSFCNAYKYIIQLVSLLCELPPFALPTPSSFV